MMAYIKPEDVQSPKANWRLVDVILDGGEGDCAYSIGMWDNRRCVGFRWNGTDDSPLGNPQSRGIPTWIMLDAKLNPYVSRLVGKKNPEKLKIVRAFFGKPVEPTG